VNDALVPATPALPPLDSARAQMDPAPPPLDKDPARIAGMFDAIAARYDLLNTVLSGGIDRYWRWRAVRSLRLTGRETAVDLCTGTADLVRALSRPGRAARVVGVDFSAEMLRRGRAKMRGVPAGHAPYQLARGDAMRIPLATASADGLTIAFGIRNVRDHAAAVADCLRVLTPGGRLAILEISMPRIPVLRQVYAWYFTRLLPRIGRLVSRHTDAYTYLPASVGAWVTPEAFCATLTAAGFAEVRAVSLTLGTVYLFTAIRPDRGARG
jgi:demethylmenaquinone methyltransferase / 2-methoxy-6-polyprenyl-1,4-benzoquinol methylase